MATETLQRTYFDYNAVQSREVRAALRKHAANGKAILKRTGEGIWQMGQILTDAKGMLPHGDFMRWCESEFNLNYGTASNFMQVYRAFKIEIISNLEAPPTVLYALAAPSVDSETREVAADLIESGDLRTVADAREVIEAGKPPEKRKPEGHQAVEEPKHPDDGVDSVEFAPEQDPPRGIDGYGRPREAPAREHKPGPVTVVKDTLSEVKPEAEMSDGEWLQTIPLFRVLEQNQGKGLIARRGMLDYRAGEDALRKFATAAARMHSVKHPDDTPFSRLVGPVARMKHPRDWGICAPCKGTGCARCGLSGVDLLGGIDPLKVEAGEVVL